MTVAMVDLHDGAGALSRALAERAEAVCRCYLSAGQRSGHYWTVGDVDNKPGRSLYVRLTGPTSGKAAAGRWCDAATGQHGDLLDLIALNQRHARLRDAMDEARRFLALPSLSFDAGRRIRSHHRAPDTVEIARRLFHAGQPIRGTLAERYLVARGVVLDSKAAAFLHFHPAMLYRETTDDPRRSFPALLAPVTDLAGTLTGVHRTYLDPRTGSRSDPGLGKAPVATPRRSLGRLAGHGVRLRAGDGSTWLVGEGVETVLSLAPLFPGAGIVAALSAAHLAMLTLPTSEEAQSFGRAQDGAQAIADYAKLIIARDNDAAGCRAADRLCRRAEASSYAVTVLRPRLIDFNADLRRWGAEPLRHRTRLQLCALAGR